MEWQWLGHLYHSLSGSGSSRLFGRPVIYCKASASHQKEGESDRQQCQIDAQGAPAGRYLDKDQSSDHHQSQKQCRNPYTVTDQHHDSTDELYQSNHPGHQTGSRNACLTEKSLNPLDSCEFTPSCTYNYSSCHSYKQK